MQALFVSTAAVALAEIGDKTQLLSLLLAARYRQPLPICLGILTATLLNHALAGGAGALLAHWLTPDLLKWIVAASLLAMGVWMLIPDRIDDDAAASSGRHGVFVASVFAFFLAEMGDKTQVATLVLAAQYQPLWQVVIGTTLGMLLANVPVVWLGARFAARLPMRSAHAAAAVLFVLLAVWVALR
ncbi:MAG: TMEM165/GDT1 family protein [Dokdonella sp.]|nr:TMEM165/GDT1 family protein [Dokdonella sp.]